MNRKTLDDIKKEQREQKKRELPQAKEGEVMFHWFANGYKINDEEFQDASIPENAELLKQMESGKVPRSLQQRYPEAENFVLNDKKKEIYRPPSPPKEKFAGKAISLSGNSVSQQPQQQQQQQSQQKGVNVNATKIKLNPSKDVENIQIQFHNGEKTNIQVNNSTKVQEVFDYVMQAAPVQGYFQLIAGFPPKPIMDLNQTVEDADVIDSKVIQKII